MTSRSSGPMRLVLDSEGKKMVYWSIPGHFGATSSRWMTAESCFGEKSKNTAVVHKVEENALDASERSTRSLGQAQHIFDVSISEEAWRPPALEADVCEWVKKKKTALKWWQW